MSKQPGDLIEKDPQSIEPYVFNWTDYLAELDPELVILTSVFEVTCRTGESPVALEIDSESILPGGLKTKFVMSGGTVGKTYTVTNRISVLGDVPTDDRSVRVKVVQK